MARARNIKPGFFKNEILAELEMGDRLLFIGLWTLADREGRLEDRPKRIRIELFAFDDVDVDKMLATLHATGFILRYEIDGVKYIQITNFVRHQDPHYKEKASEIPPPAGQENKMKANNISRTQRKRILERDGYKCQSCGATDHLCLDHILPVSRGGDSSDENLQVLCSGCNTKKGNKLEGEKTGFNKKRGVSFSDTSDFDPIIIQGRPEIDSMKTPVAVGFSDSRIPSSLIPEPIEEPTPTAVIVQPIDEVQETIQRVWNYYVLILGRASTYTFTYKRKSKAIARYQDCLKLARGDPEEAAALMKRAVDALASSQFHRDGGYIDWDDNLFKSTEQLQKWLDKKQEKPNGKTEQRDSRNDQAERDAFALLGHPEAVGEVLPHGVRSGSIGDGRKAVIEIANRASAASD